MASKTHGEHGESGEGHPDPLHEPRARELERALFDLVESIVLSALVDALEEEAAEPASPQHCEARHDELTRVERQERWKVLEAVLTKVRVV